MDATDRKFLVPPAIRTAYFNIELPTGSYGKLTSLNAIIKE